MSGEGGTSCEVELVSCSLSDLSSCLCLQSSSGEEGSGRRKKISNQSDIPAEEIFLSAKRTSLTRKPTSIDRLLHRNRTALIMGPKKANRGGSTSAGVKRKRGAEELACSSKKPRTEATPTEDPEVSNKRGRKLGLKLDPLGLRKLKRKIAVDHNGARYSTRITKNKVRIPFSLRSGRKLADTMKQKKMRRKNEKDSNSNVCSGETNGLKSDDDSKSSVNMKKETAPKKTPAKTTAQSVSTPLSSKGDDSSVADDVSVPNESDTKKKRKKRKRCSMWVNRTKKGPKKSASAGEVNASDEDEENGVTSDVSLPSSATQDSSASCLIEKESDVSTPSEPAKAENTSPDEAKSDYVQAEVKFEKCEIEDKAEVVEELGPTAKEESTTEHGAQCAELVSKVESFNDIQDTSKVEIKVENSPKEDVLVEETLKEEVKESEGGDTKAECGSEQSATGVDELCNGGSLCLEQESFHETPGTLPSSPRNESSVQLVTEDVPGDATTHCETQRNDTEEALAPIASCVNLARSSVETSSSPEENVSTPGCPLGEKPVEVSEPPGTDGVETVELAVDESEVVEVVPSLGMGNTQESNKDSSSSEKVDDDTELRRDADSTTCDNPKCLDDSFGDLSLYVSEEDMSLGKDHDGELPDSTNVTQSEEILQVPIEEGAAIETPVDSLEVKQENLIDAHFLETLDKEDGAESLSEEQKQMKESVLQALGLKSLTSDPSDAPEEKPPKRSDGYTGTLKAVIKLNRSGDKNHMVYKRSEDDLTSSEKLEYRICSEVPSDGRPIENKNLPSVDHSEASEEDGSIDDGNSKEPNLVIPEKSSSFSIHPGRLCSDVCSYCFGKFGSLDTPCHVAQIKGEERQRKILENEPHLTGESCLCDACYRYVDRKANFPEKLKVSRLKPPTQASVCCVSHCQEPATRTIKRKWLVKLKKNITNKLNIDMDKLGPGVYYPLCTQHHYWVEYFTVCGICRKRLNRNNLFSLGSEADRLNLMLAEDGIPARLSVNLFLCKLCRYYADLRLKYPNPDAIPSSNQTFYKNYRRKILMSLDIPVSDSDDELLQPENDTKKNHEDGSCKDDKTEEDVMSLSGLATLLGDQPQPQARIQVKFGNVNIGTLSNLNIGQQGGSSAATAPPPVNPGTSNHPSANGNVSSNLHKEPYSDINLIAKLEYQGPNTPDGSWERYNSTLQFDKKTKQLWTELQRPYGSQTSFLRHLVMLERVWRDGYLILSSDSDESATRYITSARNRIRAFENQGPKMSSSAANPPPTCSVVSPPVEVPVVPLSLSTTCATTTTVGRPLPSAVVKKPPPPQNAAQNFPFLATGEIEVTPIRAAKPSPPLMSVSRPPPVNPLKAGTSQRNVVNGPFGIKSQPINPSRKITPLDRAKSLVRMAPIYQQIQQHTQVGGERRGGGSMGMRFMNHAGHSSIPPLVRLPQTQPTQYYQQSPMFHMSQQQIQQHISNQQALYQIQPQPSPRMVLPKLPRALTVTSMPPRPSLPQAITLSHSGITIEKQTAPSRASTLPIERPSISVFREPAT